MPKWPYIVLGAAAGAGLALIVLGASRQTRPAAKAAVRAGLSALNNSRVKLEELIENTEDLVAEVQSEMAAEAAAGSEFAAAAAAYAEASETEEPAKPKARKAPKTKRKRKSTKTKPAKPRAKRERRPHE